MMPTVRTRQLGHTTATAVGAGDVSLSIAASRGVDRGDTERALTAALSTGLTLVDVHPGEADAERLAGDVVRALRGRDRITISVTLPVLDGRDTPIYRLPAGYIQTAVESALRTTRLDVMPLVFLPLRPTWPSSKAWPEIVGTAHRLVREGKVLAWGMRLEDNDVANPTVAAERDPDDDSEDETSPIAHLAPLLAEHWFSSLSVVFNACVRTAGALIDAVLAPPHFGPLAAPASAAAGSSLILSPFEINEPAPSAPGAKQPGSTRQLAVLARQPLAGRALAGTLGPGVKLTQRDDRAAALDLPMLERLALASAKLARLVRTTPPAATSTQAARDIVASMKRPENITSFTLAELALRYVIDRGAIALPRLHRHEHVPEALMAGTADPLTPDIVKILDGIS